ncbi:MAG: tRNA 5-methoxyuridine(34)/uridine 5-oxyacetic acid(34) synthase CmoB [Planctomycetales bacterium]|nr:tRNA 5-methoxyuridine(34)/uridine 5-oxyacetic acid(34) synthase CmoB [Planctomycetales bacterium]
MFEFADLFEWLSAQGLNAWCKELKRLCNLRLQDEHHGTMQQWRQAWLDLPHVSDGQVDGTNAAVEIKGSLPPDQIPALRHGLMAFHPWRKGPFRFFGQTIDSEWRSDWKWDRIKDAIDLNNKRVLDVGCGNGYYGWRMLAAGADRVLGCEPFLLYCAQFAAAKKYAPLAPHHVVPLADHELPFGRIWDVVFSMGVLYHRTSPIDHLQKLRSVLKPQGQLILETLIIEDPTQSVLVPENRYAKMRNVWFIPSIEMLELWLRRTGFYDITLLNVSNTNLDEQRPTEWMKFESLIHFLDEKDLSKTIEGYPAPVRALVLARCSI